MSENKKKKPLHERTIDATLHRQWRKQQRSGDSVKLQEMLGVSKPTIDKALIYGCVHKERISDTITDYFLERIEREKEAAQKLFNAEHSIKSPIEVPFEKGVYKS